MKLSKIFFLMAVEDRLKGKFKFYSFVPYKYGPYSFEMFHDIETMEKKDMLTCDDKSVSFLEGNADISHSLAESIDHYLSEYIELDDYELIDYIYEKYPEYTIFSKLEKKMMYRRDVKGVYSVGYEGLSVDEFMMKMIGEKVQVLIDVRNNPWSMKFGYTKFALQAICNNLGIEYVTLPALGIPGELRKDLHSQKDYQDLFGRYLEYLKNKEKEIGYLENLAREKKIAIMCFEKDPDHCHRTIIVKELEKRETGVSFN